MKTSNAQFSAIPLLFFLCCGLFYLPTSQRGTEGFWKSVAHYVPREPTEIRILNPYFIQEAAFQFIGLPFNNGLMGKGVRRAGTLLQGHDVFACEFPYNLHIFIEIGFRDVHRKQRSKLSPFSSFFCLMSR